MAIEDPTHTAEIMNSIIQAREHSYEEFLKKGHDYTRDYLNSFNFFRKFLVYMSLSKESNRYHGARMALEEMTKNK